MQSSAPYVSTTKTTSSNGTCQKLLLPATTTAKKRHPSGRDNQNSHLVPQAPPLVLPHPTLSILILTRHQVLLGEQQVSVLSVVRLRSGSSVNERRELRGSGGGLTRDPPRRCRSKQDRRSPSHEPPLIGRGGRSSRGRSQHTAREHRSRGEPPGETRNTTESPHSTRYAQKDCSPRLNTTGRKTPRGTAAKKNNKKHPTKKLGVCSQ